MVAVTKAGGSPGRGWGEEGGGGAWGEEADYLEQLFLGCVLHGSYHCSLPSACAVVWLSIPMVP